MRIVYALIYIYLLLRPYYFFSSGSIQISDMFLIVAFVLFLFVSKDNKKALFDNIKSNRLYGFFLVCVAVINTIYAIIYSRSDFMHYTLFYIFNFMVIILFLYLLKDEEFLKNMNNIMKINLIIQLIINLLGKGRMYGGSRYMGTFNDPNQFAYFILLTYSFIYLLNYKYKKNTIVFLLIAFFLIADSASTGMLLGISLFIGLALIDILKRLPSIMKKHTKEICFSALVLMIVISLYGLMSILRPQSTENLLGKLNIDFLMTRVNEKFNKAENENGNLLQERGYDRMYYYPQYMIFGAGEGYFGRWSKAYHQGELHATFPSILFNYGIVSLYLILRWIYTKIKNLKIHCLIVYIALFIESFTLLNSRQALFWIIILMGVHLVDSNCKEDLLEDSK